MVSVQKKLVPCQMKCGTINGGVYSEISREAASIDDTGCSFVKLVAKWLMSRTRIVGGGDGCDEAIESEIILSFHHSFGLAVHI